MSKSQKCRLCLRPISVIYQVIQKDVAKQIQKVTSVKITELGSKDETPVLCEYCKIILDIIETFQKSAVLADSLKNDKHADCEQLESKEEDELIFNKNLLLELRLLIRDQHQELMLLEQTAKNKKRKLYSRNFSRPKKKSRVSVCPKIPDLIDDSSISLKSSTDSVVNLNITLDFQDCSGIMENEEVEDDDTSAVSLRRRSDIDSEFDQHLIAVENMPLEYAVVKEKASVPVSSINEAHSSKAASSKLREVVPVPFADIKDEMDNENIPSATNTLLNTLNVKEEIAEESTDINVGNSLVFIKEEKIDTVVAGDGMKICSCVSPPPPSSELDIKEEEEDDNDDNPDENREQEFELPPVATIFNPIKIKAMREKLKKILS